MRRVVAAQNSSVIISHRDFWLLNNGLEIKTKIRLNRRIGQTDEYTKLSLQNRKSTKVTRHS